MAIEKVYAYLDYMGMADRIMTFKESTATVALAAGAVGCEQGRIAKSMSFLVDKKPVLVLLAGDARVDNKKFKQAFHKRGHMIPFDQVEEYIGHAPGGVCPFAIKDGVSVFLDISLCPYDVVYPAAGDDHSAVRLTLEELQRTARSTGWVDIAVDAER